VSRVTRTEEQTAAIESWRVRYETDPAVTYKQIGAEAGVSEHLVRSYANAAGWCRAPEVHAAMLAAAERANAARWAGKPRKSAKENKHREYIKPEAYPSIWHLARGVRVSTTRHGGQHIEVSA
jgi:hypothetical protein